MCSDKQEKGQVKAPKVTVLMSAYNEERFIRESVDSILKQTFRDFEFLIINDGSTDGTHDILQSYDDSRIRIINNNQNIGLTKSLNRGLSLARGEYIARQDANDISHPDRLDLQINFMNNNPHIAVLGTQRTFIDIKGSHKIFFGQRKPLTSLGAKYEIMLSVPVIHPTVVYSKKIIWDEFKGYDPEYVVAQDAELWCRVGVNYSIQNLPQALVDFRIDPSSVTGDVNHPRRINHSNRWRKRLPEAMKEILRRNDIPPNVGEVWVDLQDPKCAIDSASVLKFIRDVDVLQEIFNDVYPEACGNKEVDAATADVKVYASFYLLKQSRIDSMYVYFNCIRRSPGVWIKYLPKYITLLIFGSYARYIAKVFGLLK